MLLMRWRRRRLQALETPLLGCHRSRGACTAILPLLAPAEALVIRCCAPLLSSTVFLALPAPQPMPQALRLPTCQAHDAWRACLCPKHSGQAAMHNSGGCKQLAGKLS